MTMNFRDRGALSTVLQKTDRILSDAPVTISFHSVDYLDSRTGVKRARDPQISPSYVRGNAISLSSAVVGDYMEGSQTETEFMVRVLGLNYHELSHVLYTPQFSTDIGQRVARADLHGQYNALEDQRIENMFCAQYQSAHRYFTYTVLTHIIDKSEPGKAFPLVYGRKYLPTKIRRAVENKFDAPQDILDGLKEVIDEYIDIPYPNHCAGNAFALVQRYAQLLAELHHAGGMPDPQVGKADCSSRNNEGTQSKNDPAYRQGEREISERSIEAQKQRGEMESESHDEDEEESQTGNAGDVEESIISDSAENSGAGQSPESDGDETDETASGSGEQSEEPGTEPGTESGASESVDSAEGVPSGDGAFETPAEDSGAAEGTARGTDDGQRGAGTGSTPGVTAHGDVEHVEENITDTLAEEQDKILNNVDVQRETENTSQSFNRHRKQFTHATQEVSDVFHPITDTMRSERNRTRIEISRLLDTVAPGWQYGSHAGVINVPRYIQSEHGDEDIWDAWDEGRESDIGCEVYIGLDASGSMGMSGNIGNACQALWVMKSAFDELGVSTVVTTFGDPTNERMVYGRNDRVRPNEYLVINPSFGSTIPNANLEVANGIMQDSEKKNKLLIMITDGMWDTNLYGGRDWVPVIREMENVTKLLVCVNVHPYPAVINEFDHVYHTNSTGMASLGSTLRDVVMATMRGRATR